MLQVVNVFIAQKFNNFSSVFFVSVLNLEPEPAILQWKESRALVRDWSVLSLSACLSPQSSSSFARWGFVPSFPGRLGA